MALAQDIVRALKEMLPPAEFTALHEPSFVGGSEWDYVKECLDTGWVSSAGKFVDRFEEMLAHFTGVERAIAVVNGTVALSVALHLAGVEPGDEVIIPALTFVATANAVSHLGAVPHFADCEERTLGLDPEALAGYLDRISQMKGGECFNRASGRRIRAVVPMHIYGHPMDLKVLDQVCSQYSLVMVEDAAESLGSYYKGRHTGGFGLLGTLSFNGNKIITTGGGGAILTNNHELADAAKHLTTTAKLPHRWAFVHDQVGYNYRLPNLNAALGCAQLEKLNGFVEKKRALARRYEEAFAGVGGVSIFTEPADCRSNYWLNVLILDQGLESQLEPCLAATNDAGLMTRPAWELMHRLPMYESCPRMELPIAESLAARIINIPSSPQLAG